MSREPAAPYGWRDREIRDGRDTLRLLAELRGGPTPWPTDSDRQPLVVATPSGGRHLWYQAPAGDLRQAIGELAWQVDIKAGWSYGLAPSTHTGTGRYRILSGNIDLPGRMPDWLATEITRVATHKPPPAPADSAVTHLRGDTDGAPAAYLTTVINHGAARLAGMTDGRQRALSALAYQAGGLLAWSALNPDTVTTRLIDAGTTSGLPQAKAARIVHRALTRGTQQPLAPPRPRADPRESA